MKPTDRSAHDLSEPTPKPMIEIKDLLNQAEQLIGLCSPPPYISHQEWDERRTHWCILKRQWEDLRVNPAPVLTPTGEQAKRHERELAIWMSSVTLAICFLIQDRPHLTKQLLDAQENFLKTRP